MDPLVELLGESPGIVAVRREIGRLLERSSSTRRLLPVLIEGETGTGKGLVARAIHRAGPRANGPFVDINCAAIPETLLEAELFGFERGAFTDARQAKPGLFQTAHRGTLVLDEIGLMPAGLQVKLLKVIEERVVRRLGSTRTEAVDVWILAATSEDLLAATQRGGFRPDLYHRLAAVTIVLPPLRERGDDICLLAEHFLSRACADYALAPKAFTTDARDRLKAYAWPGNIRELANVIERVALLSEESQVTGEMLGLREPPRAAEPETARPRAGASLDDVMRQTLLDALTRTNWNVSRAALELGVTRNTIRARIEKYGLRRGEPSVSPSHPSPERTLPLQAPRSDPLVPRPLSDVRWTRRHLTLLKATFVDREADLVPATGHLLQRFVEKLQTFGGQLEGLSPTGLVAVFGMEPVEDAPLRAAHAAMAIQNAAEHAQRATGESYATRIGIHVAQYPIAEIGEAVELDLDAKHQTLTLLDTLVEEAGPQTVVVSDAAVPFLERRFELTAVGVSRAETGRVYRMTAREQTGFRVAGRPAPFVGRSHELDFLRNRMASVRSGHGHVVGIVGESGIGKSRLLHEFRRGLGEEPVTYLEGRCASYGAAMAFLPIVELLRHACDLAENDSPEAVGENVCATLERLGIDPDEAAPYVLQLFGVKGGAERLITLTPETIRDRTLGVLQQMIVTSSRQRPLILAIEDLHWIDSASEALLASLVESLAGAAILLLVTYRPGYRSPALERSYATQLALLPLSPRASIAVAESILGTTRITDIEAEALVAKTEGNPFFIEELARAIVERGQLRAAIPDSIHAVLSARINQLQEDSKRLLQIASVLGRQVSPQLLSAMWDRPQDCGPHLRDITEREFLQPRPGNRESAYVFKHAVTQEVAYDSIPPIERRTLHATAGHALEHLYGDRQDEICDLLAYHYSKTRETEKAISYLARSAGHAARRYAHVEAVAALQEARTRLRTVRESADRDRTMVDYVLREAHSLHLLGRMTEAQGLLAEHRELVERLDDGRLTGPFYFWVARTYSVLGDRDMAAASLATAIAAAERAADDVTLGKSYFLLAFEDFWVGRLAAGIEHARHAVARLSATDESWWLGMSYWALALNSLVMGDLQGASVATEHVARLGDATGDPRLKSCASWMAGWIHATRGEWAPAIASCEQAQREARDTVGLFYATGQLASAYLDSGDAAQAVRLFEKAVADADQLRPAARQTQSRFMALLAEAYASSGDLTLAETTARDALGLAESVRHAYAAALATRALARVAERRGAYDEADQYLTTALSQFQSIEAAGEVARTLLRKAELAAARGDNTGRATDALTSARQAFRSLGMSGYEAIANELASRLQ